jgi:hypothetical protein
MLRIDNGLLEEVGLSSLPDSEKNSLLKHIYETLEMRVGIRLADQMSNEQLDEFERYFEAKDDAGAFKWLETNFPNYKEIVQEEFEKLKSEISQSAPQILSSSQVQPGVPGVAAAQQQQPPVVAAPQQPIYQNTPLQDATAPQQQYQQPPVQPLQQPLSPQAYPDPPQTQAPQPQQPPYPTQQPPAGPTQF